MRFFMFTLCFWLISFPSLGQGIASPAGVMTVKQDEWVWKSGIRVELDGYVYRPAAAARLCSGCPQARHHFLAVKRKRAWSFGLANLGIVQSVTGAVQLENENAIGAFNAAVGGLWMTLGVARDRAARRELQSAVDAYNRCQFFER
jgi:hypothetical protein